MGVPNDEMVEFRVHYLTIKSKGKVTHFFGSIPFGLVKNYSVSVLSHIVFQNASFFSENPSHLKFGRQIRHFAPSSKEPNRTKLPINQVVIFAAQKKTENNKQIYDMIIATVIFVTYLFNKYISNPKKNYYGNKQN